MSFPAVHAAQSATWDSGRSIGPVAGRSAPPGMYRVTPCVSQAHCPSQMLQGVRTALVHLETKTTACRAQCGPGRAGDRQMPPRRGRKNRPRAIFCLRFNNVAAATKSQSAQEGLSWLGSDGGGTWAQRSLRLLGKWPALRAPSDGPSLCRLC